AVRVEAVERHPRPVPAPAIRLAEPRWQWWRWRTVAARTARRAGSGAREVEEEVRGHRVPARLAVGRHLDDVAEARVGANTVDRRGGVQAAPATLNENV